MRGILLTEFKVLLESLNKLRQADKSNFLENQFEILNKKEIELHEIYANYKISLLQVSENIRQFENQKHSIRRLIKKSKLDLKAINKISETYKNEY